MRFYKIILKSVMSLVCQLSYSSCSNLLIHLEVLPEIWQIRCSMLWFGGQLENLFQILIMHRLIDFVNSDLKHLHFIKDIEHFAFFFRRWLLSHLIENLLSNSACWAHISCYSIIRHTCHCFGQWWGTWCKVPPTYFSRKWSYSAISRNSFIISMWSSVLKGEALLKKWWWLIATHAACRSSDSWSLPIELRVGIFFR